MRPKGSTADRHGAARRFLTPGASSTWDDNASLTVLAEQFDTVYPPTTSTDPDIATVRIRGDRLGTLDAGGAFQSMESPAEIDVTVVRDNGQWRIDHLPDGVLVRQSDFGINFRTVRAYFVDPARRQTVADLRYLPVVPAKALAARVVDMLLTGPSTALRDAAVSMIPVNAKLRSNVTETPDGALIVDLSQLGELDELKRRLVAAQVVLTLSEIDVGRVRLLVDGAPMVADSPDLTRDVVAGTLAAVAPGPEQAGLVVSGGKLRVLPGNTPGPGPAGNGSLDVVSAATTADGKRIAVVARESGQQRLLVGPIDGPLQPLPITGATLTRPTWTPGGEVWTVRDGTAVARVLPDGAGGLRTDQVDVSAFGSLGPLSDLRLSRDGVRLAAVVGGNLVTGAVVRASHSAGGEVAVRNVRKVRPSRLTQVVGVEWQADESLVVATARTDRPVMLVSSDGLELEQLPGSNLTPPLRAVAAAPNRPFLVADQGGVWSFDAGDLDSWRQVLGAAPDAIPLYPG